MNTRAIFSVSFVLLIGAASIAVTAAERRITRKDARSLVLAELKAEGYDITSPKFELDDNDDPTFDGLYAFDAYFDTPYRLAHIDAYVVDPSTAVLWEFGLCERPATPAVLQLQEVLKRRYNLRTPPSEPKPPCIPYEP